MHASNYRSPKNRPFTRKKYMRGFPQSKITKFTMGDTKAEFEYELRLISKETAQIRHNALEAARIATNRRLTNKLINEYYLVILPYPHNVLRENKVVMGAHADRISDGMRRSFGRSIGTGAIVKPNQVLIRIQVNSNGLDTAKGALKTGSAKFPMPCKITVEKIQTPSTL